MIYSGLLYIVPGLLAAVLYCIMKNIPYKSIDFILYLFIYAFLINSFVIGVGYIRGHGIYPVESLHSNIGTTAKYAFLALIVSIALPNIVFVISKFSRGINNEDK